jgi:hypothetical protein
MKSCLSGKTSEKNNVVEIRAEKYRARAEEKNIGGGDLYVY